MEKFLKTKKDIISLSKALIIIEVLYVFIDILMDMHFSKLTTVVFLSNVLVIVVVVLFLFLAIELAKKDKIWSGIIYILIGFLEFLVGSIISFLLGVVFMIMGISYLTALYRCKNKN
jgi:hypothetical protein